MKTTLDLPEDLVRQLKRKAHLEKRRLKDVAVEALRFGLREEVSKLCVDQVLPIYQGSPDAPVTRMSLSEILAVEQAILNGEMPNA